MDKFDHHFMNDAVNVAKLSYCNRKKVGAVLVKDRRPLTNGYNGTLTGMENSCECDDGKGNIITNELTLHAEQNIITYCAKEGIPTDGTTIYLTLSPCKTCAKLMASSGITRVVYKETYRDMEGVDFLKKVGILVEKYNDPLDEEYDLHVKWIKYWDEVLTHWRSGYILVYKSSSTYGWTKFHEIASYNVDALRKSLYLKAKNDSQFDMYLEDCSLQSWNNYKMGSDQ